jgi:hypothetical protein
MSTTVHVEASNVLSPKASEDKHILGVAVGVSVTVGVGLKVTVRVKVGVGVGVELPVLVGVGVLKVGVAVGVIVLVGVGVGVGVGVEVGVAVEVFPPPQDGAGTPVLGSVVVAFVYSATNVPLSYKQKCESFVSDVRACSAE